MYRLTFGVVLVVVVLVGSLRADGEDLGTQLMRATVRVSHDKSSGTGFVLSRPHRNQFVLVTAAHVLENIPGDEAVLGFRRREAEGVYKKLPAKVIIRQGGETLWTKHPSQDVAALAVVPPDGADLPTLSTDLLATDTELKKYRVHPGDRVALLGYPHRVEANEAGFPVLRSGPVASFPLVPTRLNKTFLLSTNTFEGDSGGPVFLAESRRALAEKGRMEDVRLIVGLVTGQHFLDEEMKMVYGTTKIRHRLGLAIVVQAAFIRETLDSLP
jgi:hypothetical protein